MVASSDLEIYHTTTNGSFIRDVGCGNFNIQTDGNGIFIEKSTGSNMGVFRPDAQVELYYNGSEKFGSTNTGISIEGNIELGTGGYIYGDTTTAYLRLNNAAGTVLGYSTGNISIGPTFVYNTSSGEKFRINHSNGNVGIGTSSPQELLHIDNPTGASSILLEGAAGWYSQILFRTNPASAQGWFLYDYSANVMTFGTNASEKMRLTSTGLGIGTSSPSAKLQSVSPDGNTLSFRLGRADTSNFWDFNHAGNDLRIYNEATSGSNILLGVDAGGTVEANNVGIGTATPSEKLHVVGDALITGDSHADAFKPAVSGNPIKFKNFGTIEFARITSEGRLGIGVINPSEKLEVDGKAIIRNSGSATAHGDTDLFVTDATAASSTAAIQILGGSAGFSNIQFSDTVFYSQGAIIYSHTDNYMAFKANTSEKMRLTSGGDLAIGRTTASEKLDVQGNIILRGTNNLTIGSTSSGGDFSLSSGIRGYKFANNNGDLLTLSSDGNLTVTGSGSFTGQVTVPATPVASTDAASKGYVDTQVGSADTLQEVTDNGNTTTNSVTFAGGTSTGDITGQSITLGDGSADKQLKVFYSDGSFISYKGYAIEFNRANSYIIPTVTNSKNIYIGNNTLGYWNQIESNAVTHKWTNASSEKMRLTSGGFLGLGASSPASKLDIHQGGITLDTDWPIKFGPNAQIEGNTSGTKIRFDATAGFNWTDGGTTNMQLLDNGNLLLGTTTDSGAKLNVQGSLQVGVDDTGYDVTFYGATSGEYLQWDASDDSLEFRDNVKAKFGNSGDFHILRNATDSFLENSFGHIFISNSANDKDIRLATDDGTGGVTNYIVLDGSQATVNVYKTLLIGTTTNTGAYKIDVAGKQRVQDTLELDDVLMLNAISTPSDPAAGKSVIYMDSSDGGIKCKINVGGTVVTRTIASFE